MIQEKDIDIFLRAKKDELSINVLFSLSFLSLILLLIMEGVDSSHEYTKLLATMAAVFMGWAIGQNRWVNVTRSQLIKALENIINTDAQALKLLSEKRVNNAGVKNHT